MDSVIRIIFRAVKNNQTTFARAMAATMKKIIFNFILSLISVSAFAQSYNGPESVEYDPTGNRYFIANSSNGQILSRAANGTLSIFAQGISPNPYGIEMAWGNLYACCGNSIKGFNMSGTQIFSVNVGASFLNGLAHDNSGNLYATDFSAILAGLKNASIHVNNR